LNVFREFNTWIKSEGAYFEKLKLRHYGDANRGVHASRAI